MKLTGSRAAAVLAALLASAVLARVAGGGRKLAAALGSAPPAGMSAGSLRHCSTSLQRHLKRNPQDLLAAQLLNDVDAEIIRRS